MNVHDEAAALLARHDVEAPFPRRPVAPEPPEFEHLVEFDPSEMRLPGPLLLPRWQAKMFADVGLGAIRE